jgi:hypothetical protein
LVICFEVLRGLPKSRAIRVYEGQRPFTHSCDIGVGIPLKK